LPAAKSGAGILADADIPTSERAVSEAFKKSAGWARCLEDRAWDLVHQIGQAPVEVQDHAATTSLVDVIEAAYEPPLRVFVKHPVLGVPPTGSPSGPKNQTDPLVDVTTSGAELPRKPGDFKIFWRLLASPPPAAKIWSVFFFATNHGI